MTGYLSSALYLLPSFSRYADICTGVPQNKMPRATIVVKRLVVKEGRRRLPSAIKFLTKARLRYLSSTHDDHDGQIVIAVRELPPCPHSQQLYGLWYKLFTQHPFLCRCLLLHDSLPPRLRTSFMNGPIHIMIQKEAPNNVKSRLTHIQVEHTRMILHKKPWKRYNLPELS